MPGLQHEAIVSLLRDQPALVRWLLSWFTPHQLAADAPIIHRDPNSSVLKPVEFKADLAFETPSLGVVVEVQRSIDRRKKRAWPVYSATMRKRLCQPVELLVVPTRESVAQWADQPIDIDESGSVMRPTIARPRDLIEIAESSRDPSIWLLCVLACIDEMLPQRAVQLAGDAMVGLQGIDEDTAAYYLDVLIALLGPYGDMLRERVMRERGGPYSDWGRERKRKMEESTRRAEENGLERGLEQGLEQGLEREREALLRIAARVADEAELEKLQAIEDIDALETAFEELMLRVAQGES